MLLEINDERATQNRYTRVEPMAEFVPTVEGGAAPSEHPPLPSKAA